MEVDLIILAKDTDDKKVDMTLKKQIHALFEKLYIEMTDEKFCVDISGQEIEINYKVSAKTANMLFVKASCAATPAKAAKALDIVVNKLLRGEHRKHWNIVLSYDEVSQYYCCKLMPLFGVFERRTRELVYLTIVKIFGVEWYDKSFAENLKNELKSKGNKTKLVENALNELTYEQLKTYLFEPFSSSNPIEVLNNQLSQEKLQHLSKEQIIEIIDKCRMISLWDRFFSEYEEFNDFKSQIETLQPLRNTVMHHKRLTLREFENTRKELKYVNKKLEKAITLLEDEIYTETKLVDVVSAMGRMLQNVLGNSVQQWAEKMKPALAALGRIAIESAMPKINVIDIVPGIVLGTELSKKFAQLYHTSDIVTNLSPALKSFQVQMPKMGCLNGVLNSPSMIAIRDIAKKANQFQTLMQSQIALAENSTELDDEEEQVNISDDLEDDSSQ